MIIFVQVDCCIISCYGGFELTNFQFLFRHIWFVDVRVHAQDFSYDVLWLCEKLCSVPKACGGGKTILIPHSRRPAALIRGLNSGCSATDFYWMTGNCSDVRWLNCGIFEVYWLNSDCSDVCWLNGECSDVFLLNGNCSDVCWRNDGYSNVF